ncbi:MAG: ROK family protein [Clostridia bacterium]|nr:ROK family protein [Clostridia bacterium]
MRHAGIEFEIGNVPELDRGFVPFGKWLDAYLRQADRPIRAAVQREDGRVVVFDGALRGAAWEEANQRYLERWVKLLLWSVGGSRVWLTGCDGLARQLREDYRPGGRRSFDVDFMQTVFERPFEVVPCSAGDFPRACPGGQAGGGRLGGHLEGCRIGFDAGGSDRKVSAVIDGKAVYSEEVVWHPKLSEDPDYQYREILTAFETAAAHLPRVDAIGVSSAGVLVGNHPMVSSLFIKVPKARHEAVKHIYERAAGAIGNVPLAVANDGDVTALAGAMGLNRGRVLGIAMGTSEAAGYVDAERNLLGWFNELAFAPVDLQPGAPADEWSGDRGVGCKYFSQDAVIRLARPAGIRLPEALTPAEKLLEVQDRMKQGHEGAAAIFRIIGTYLGHTLPLYARLYDIDTVLVMGRVASGAGGDVLIDACNRVLREEYGPLAAGMTVMLPDEKARRVGQSIAAASLPERAG